MQAILVNYLPLLFTLLSLTFAAAPGQDAILLSNVQTLTLHGGRMTSHRRVSPVPQLKCVGPSSRICNLYSIDTMRCTNQGHAYDEEDIEWTCTASLPAEFKLGSTNVICEGYRDSNDPWVLKGSCGVEYRLLLTDEGEKRYGHHYAKHDTTDDKPSTSSLGWVFWLVLFVILVLVLFTLCDNNSNPRRRGSNRRRRPRGPGGGGGGWDDPRDPPPPYDYNPDTHWKPSTSSSSSRPGFWTGAAAGATTGGAAGYAMGRRSRGSSSFQTDPGEGSSRRSSGFSSTSPSTGFGSTQRR
jgi:hypothetical protein